MRFHSQNLNDERGVTGSIWRHGRCWLNWKNHARGVGLEWVFGWRAFAFEFELATHDHALAGHLSLFLFSLYWHYENSPLFWWLQNKIKRPDEKYGNGRQIGVRFHEEYIWIDLWYDPMEHRSADPWWWHISIVPKDLLLGRTQYSEEGTPKTSRVEVPMPEANYPATVKLYVAQWKRPRWPWPQRLMRAEITPDTPIPFPGKGENSWDCGEDATHSMTCMAQNEHEAVSKLVSSVLRDRYRNGGKDWRPATSKQG